MSDQWLTLARFFLPVLTGLLLFLLLCRALSIWQDRTARTWRNVWFFLMYSAFFVVCLSRSLNLAQAWVVISYMLLVLFLAPAVWSDWWNFIQFLRAKNTNFIAGEPGAQLMTLDTLARDDVHAVLDATPAEPESGGNVALEATPVKPKG